MKYDNKNNMEISRERADKMGLSVKRISHITTGKQQQ
jgi:hypothetical protein